MVPTYRQSTTRERRIPEVHSVKIYSCPRWQRLQGPKTWMVQVIASCVFAVISLFKWILLSKQVILFIRSHKGREHTKGTCQYAIRANWSIAISLCPDYCPCPSSFVVVQNNNLRPLISYVCTSLPMAPLCIHMISPLSWLDPSESVLSLVTLISLCGKVWFILDSSILEVSFPYIVLRMF